MAETQKELGFHGIRKVENDGFEHWSARDLMVELGYSTWQKFLSVITKAQVACTNSGQNTENHFIQTVKMVEIGSKSERGIDDFELTRYAGFLMKKRHY